MASVEPRGSQLRSRIVVLLSLTLLPAFTLLAACNHNVHTTDPRLLKIDQLLSSHLPKGTSRGGVEYFLRSRGFQIEDAGDKTKVRALVRHVDPQTLQPSAAHATFHFDAYNKLVTYELEPASF